MLSNRSPVVPINLSVERMTNPPSSIERDSETPKRHNTIEYTSFKPKLPRKIEKSRNFTTVDSEVKPTTSSLSPQRLLDLQSFVSPRQAFSKPHFQCKVSDLDPHRDDLRLEIMGHLDDF